LPELWHNERTGCTIVPVVRFAIHRSEQLSLSAGTGRRFVKIPARSPPQTILSLKPFVIFNVLTGEQSFIFTRQAGKITNLARVAC